MADSLLPMASDAPATPPRKKRHVWRWIGLAVLLFLAWFCWQLFGPNPPIVVSRETTYITEPLGPDGLPDYRKYVLDKYREGVTPENNAAVLLWQVFGRDEEDDATTEELQAWTSSLGLPQVPDKQDALSALYGKGNREAVAAWLESRSDSEVPQDAWIAGRDTVAGEAIDEAMDHPWTQDLFPPLAEWVMANQRQLDLLVDASQRPKIYSPSPSMFSGTDDTLLGMTFDVISQARDAARVLSVRAMWNLGEGRYEQAWQDIVAIHCWARLVGQGGMLVDQLVAIAIDGIASADTVTLLGSGELSPELARQIQRELEELPNASAMTRTLKHGERLFGLDVIIQSPSLGLYLLLADDYSGMFGSDSFEPLDHISFDWNVVLRQTNSWHDRVAQAAGMSRCVDRNEALSEIEVELGRLEKQFKSPTAWLGGLLSQRRRSELLAGQLLNLTFSTTQGCLAAEDRANTQLSLIRLAAALTVYRAEHGTYPESLDALVPDVLPEVPVDLYHERPFHYQRDGKGYLLYSAGPNGQDDGGSSELRNMFKGRSLWDFDESEHEQLEQQIPAGADDISIRVPTPPFKLPEPAKENTEP